MSRVDDLTTTRESSLAGLTGSTARHARTAPGDETAVAVSGGGGRSAATPEDETVVAGSGVPGLFGEAGNELMCPAS
jgi:hypothetical protein